jgi:hypothetical protein
VSVDPNPAEWENVYLMRPEYAAFDHKKIEKRLEGLRKMAGKSASRASPLVVVLLPLPSDSGDAFDY